MDNNTNNTLPAEVQEEIKLKANKYVAHTCYQHEMAIGRFSYEAGATEYAQWKVKYDELERKAKDLTESSDVLANEIESVAELVKENEQLKERIANIEAKYKPNAESYVMHILRLKLWEWESVKEKWDKEIHLNGPSEEVCRFYNEADKRIRDIKTFLDGK